MLVACVIPWRGGDPHREHHREVVRAHLEQALPAAVHIDADDQTDPFSRAGSRNFGIRLAETAGADIAVICDADTLAAPEPLLAAITQAHTDGRLHLPYTWYRGLSQQGTLDHLDGRPAAECATDLQHQWATGGCLIIRPDAWWKAGGMDERCVGWGHEDVIFRICADAILGPTVKHPGTLVHLWHPSDAHIGSPQWQVNSDLCERYNSAEGDPAAIRVLISERGASVKVDL